jgi:hypothetical protein
MITIAVNIGVSNLLCTVELVQSHSRVFRHPVTSDKTFIVQISSRRCCVSIAVLDTVTNTTEVIPCCAKAISFSNFLSAVMKILTIGFNNA